MPIYGVFNLHFTSASNKFINPHSAFRIRISHCGPLLASE